MSTTSLTAGEVMDRVAALLNDPSKTDYTYAAQLPYLNMAIDEMMEALEESNAPVTNLTVDIIPIPVGQDRIIHTEYPADLVEIQQVAERRAGTNDSYIPMIRREFIEEFPPSESLLYWAWLSQGILFNPNGATTAREIRLQYTRGLATGAVNEATILPFINSRSFLSYKTASLCSQFIGENESRAALLDNKAEQALERMIGINNKGRQQIMTRHRPFRSGYKSRGGF